jgi:predicted dinucleotide-binding enzyme
MYIYIYIIGTGKIGTAVAIHLLRRDPTCHLTLVGRRPNDAARKEVQAQTGEDARRIALACIPTVWDESSTELQELVRSADCLIHAAGPYFDQKPVPLKLALQSTKCRVYVDVSDPLSYLETSLLLSEEAKSSQLTALVAAGAFPGMSNVLAKEAAQALAANSTTGVQDVRFQYFTAGLGGSGVVNLYITNLGFGEPMVQYDQGQLRWFMALSGKLLGKVQFFLPELQNHEGNERVKQRVGTQTIFAWPFPEAATVAKNVGARGNSYAGMGTAPELWNDMLGLLVKLVPRPWWRNTRFSKFMADFSEPLVLATDSLLQKTGTGETHAMRIDVTSVPPGLQKDGGKGVSIVQAHDSFRVCVGQSCAEFALDALEHPNPGVYLPEQFYDDAKDRSRIIDKLTSTPGTFCYTGPVFMEAPPDLPSDWEKAIYEANTEEENAAVGQ